MRTAFGVTALSFFVLLQVAASNDLLAHRFDASVATISWTFRIIVPVVPPVLGYVTYRLMTALQASAAERFAELPLRAVLRPAGNGAKRPEVEGVAGYAPSADGAELVVYPEPDGRWRWCYRLPDDGVELHSNKSYVSPDVAEHYALQAFGHASGAIRQGGTDVGDVADQITGRVGLLAQAGVCPAWKGRPQSFDHDDRAVLA